MQINFVEAFYLKENQNEINISTNSENIGTYKVYWTYETDPYTDNKHFLFESDKKIDIFEFKIDSKQVNYFIIEFSNHRPLLFGYRILPMAGMYNFRDIGGYRTEDGRRIKWGVGFRSDHLINLEDESFEYLKSLRLKSVIDFRSPSEVEKDPNPFFSEEVINYNFDPNAHTAMMAGGAQSKDDSKDFMKKAKKAMEEGIPGGQQMIEQQLEFVDKPDSVVAFKNTLETIAKKENNPNVQHCRGGKDRTGYALMLLKGLLGVPVELLKYDYMLTERARKDKNERYYKHFLETTQDKKIAEYMYSLYDTRVEFIEASIDKIQNNYGSIREYIQDVLDLSNKEIKNLEEIFLEDD